MIKKKLTILFALILISLLSGCLAKPKYNLIDTYYNASDENPITFVRLENGFNLMVKEEHRHPVVSFYLSTIAGSSFEDDSNLGIAHLLEHITFKKTYILHNKSANELFFSMGVPYFNAFTSKDYIGFTYTSSPDNFIEIFKVYSQLIKSPLIDEQELKKEKRVVYEEYTKELNDPYYIGSIEFDNLFYEDHPYSNPIIGYPDIFMNITEADITNFYSSFFSPDKMYLAVVGDINTKTVIDAAREAFGDLPNSKVPETQRPQLNPFNKNIEHELAADVTLVDEFIGYRIPILPSKKERYSLGLLVAMLNEELDYNVIQSGLATYASASLTGLKDDNSILFEFMSEEQNRAETENMIFDIIAAFKEGDTYPEQLERHKKDVLAKFDAIYDTVELQSETFVDYAITENVNNNEQINRIYRESEIIESIIPKDIQEVAGKYLNHHLIFATVPEK